jgi:hypothetical protein
VAKAVNYREVDDCALFTQNSVGERCTKDWEEINGREKRVAPRASFVIAHNRDVTARVHEVFRHENCHDRGHPVKANPLRNLIPDDVRNTRRHTGACLVRCRPIL